MKNYEPSPRTVGVLDKAFVSHPPKDDQLPRYSTVNEKLYQVARYLCTVTPESAEQTLMLRCLQEAKFWANEAIAKNEL